jgi:hypothetical protein
VLLRLNEDGTPDVSFGYEGVVNENPFIPDDPVTGERRGMLMGTL